METAIGGRFPLSPNTIINLKPGDKQSLYKGPSLNRGNAVAVSAAATLGKGRGVLDRPVIEKTTPGRESEFDLRSLKQKKEENGSTISRHATHDNFNRRDYVVQVLIKVNPGMTLDNAYNIMQEADSNDLSVVIICSQADAEEHCTKLRGNGLLSSIEPASDGC